MGESCTDHLIFDLQKQMPDRLAGRTDVLQPTPWREVVRTLIRMGEAEAQVVVAVGGRVVVAIGYPAVTRVIVPTASADHPMRA